MVRTKTDYTKFREKALESQQYSQIAQDVKDNKVVPNIHNFAAEILKNRGLTDEANDLRNSDTRPDNHALLGLVQIGAQDYQRKFHDFGKDNLVTIVNSTNLKKEKVEKALLLLPPKKAGVPGHIDLSKSHTDASEFYMDLYLYQQNDRLSDEDKAGLRHNMKVRVSKDYHDKFHNDKDFANRLGALVQGYNDVAIAQYKRLTNAKVEVFSDKLKTSNAGAYVKAMALSDEKMEGFYQAILNGRD